MPKIDYKKELKTFYQPSAKALAAVDVPAFSFLMIDGHGDPNTDPAYGEAVSALYALAYALKFAVKQQTAIDYAVMPLEGLWWVADMRKFDLHHKEDWDWTMLIMQPPPVTAQLFESVLPEVTKKKPNPALSRVRWQTFTEGPCAQILHLGPYSAEGPTVVRLHDFIKQNAHQLSGKHHEIYLGDPNRTQPAKLKTIVRQPFE